VFQAAGPKMLIWINQTLRVTIYIKPSLLSIIFKYCHPKGGLVYIANSACARSQQL